MAFKNVRAMKRAPQMSNEVQMIKSEEFRINGRMK